jgi:hypothetical protein
MSDRQCASSCSNSASSRWPAVASAHAMLDTPCKIGQLTGRKSSGLQLCQHESR